MADETYRADRLSHPQPQSFGFGALLQGEGVPDDANGNNGDIYIDLSTGDVYQKTSNTWTIVTGGGGGGSQEVFRGTGDPSGVQSATGAAIYLRTNGEIWIKTTAGTSNSEWVQKTT